MGLLRYVKTDSLLYRLKKQVVAEIALRGQPRSIIAITAYCTTLYLYLYLNSPVNSRAYFYYRVQYIFVILYSLRRSIRFGVSQHNSNKTIETNTTIVV